MAKLTEKRLYRVEPQFLTTDGSNTGIIIIPDTSFFVVGHIVILESDSKEPVKLKVNRIVNKITAILGPVDRPVHFYQDLSDFLIADNARIKAPEQVRPNIPEQEIERNTYDEEPIVARRVRVVDKYGDDAASAVSKIQSEDPITKFYYGPSYEIIRILEYAPGSSVGDIVKETFFTYTDNLDFLKIESINRPAVAEDLT